MSLEMRTNLSFEVTDCSVGDVKSEKYSLLQNASGQSSKSQLPTTRSDPNRHDATDDVPLGHEKVREFRFSLLELIS